MANIGVIANYPIFHGFFPNGDPLIGGKLFTYEAGTSTPRSAFYDAACTMPHQNPIILNDRGEALIYIQETMHWVLKDPNDVLLWTTDNIGGGGEVIPPGIIGVNNPDVNIGLVA